MNILCEMLGLLEYSYDGLKIGKNRFSTVVRGLLRRNFGGIEKPSATILYRFHSCGLPSLEVYKHTKKVTTDKLISPKLYPPVLREIILSCFTAYLLPKLLLFGFVSAVSFVQVSICGSFSNEHLSFNSRL